MSPDRRGGDAIPEFLLGHPTRRGIVELLERRPGMNKHQLATALDAYPSLLDSHLHRLERAGLVVTREGPRDLEVLCFLADDVHLWENPRTRILFGRRPTRDVALFLLERPGASTHEIADGLGLSRRTVRYHLRVLGTEGLIERVRIGRSVRYQAREALERWRGAVGERYEATPSDAGPRAPWSARD